MIDGRSIREYPLDTLRRSIGYVPQDTFLFSETLRENIAFGVRRAEEDIREWPRSRASRVKFKVFPHGYDTMVGERGITLSGGQKQRTSLARAILRQPEIWFSTIRCRASTRTPKSASSAACGASCGSAPRF